jgi:hypothetical protein
MLIHDAHIRLPAVGPRRGLRGAARREAPGAYRPSRFVAVRRSNWQAQHTSRVLASLIPPLR